MSPHAFISLKILSFVVFLIFYEFHFVSLIEVEEELRLTEDEHNKLEMVRTLCTLLLEIKYYNTIIPRGIHLHMTLPTWYW